MNKLAKARTIWIDLDNSPHVPFFVPIIMELEKQGHSIFLTARDTFQVIGLADYYKLKYKKVGRHYGANKLLKVVGTIWRSIQLANVLIRHKVDVSLSHGSRALLLVSWLFRIPSVLIYDYEHAKILPFIKPSLGIAPEVCANSGETKRFRQGLSLYSGIKEDVYVASFRPDSSILRQLNIREKEIIVTIRPPASEAHYHNPDSDKLFTKVVEFLGRSEGVRMIILPRNEKTQKELIRTSWPKWCTEGKIIIPAQVVDGLNLMWHSDLVISGGGTMNREAAALGLPVYSIFRGTLGAVDKYLAEHGRLVLIETLEDVENKVLVAKRSYKSAESTCKSVTLKQIMETLTYFVESNGDPIQSGPMNCGSCSRSK